jgi:hypothetical protein
MILKDSMIVIMEVTNNNSLSFFALSVMIIFSSDTSMIPSESEKGYILISYSHKLLISYMGFMSLG